MDLKLRHHPAASRLDAPFPVRDPIVELVGGNGMDRTIAGAALAAALSLATAGAGAAAPADTPSTAKPAPVQPPLNASVRDVRDIREAVPSPDGAQVAASINASTAEGGQAHVWLLSADGKSARQVTVSGADS